MNKLATEEIEKSPAEVRRVRYRFRSELIPGDFVESGTVTPSSSDIEILSTEAEGEDLIVIFRGGLVANSPYILSALADISNGEKIGIDGKVHVVAERIAMEEMLKLTTEERLLDFNFRDDMFPDEDDEEITEVDIQAMPPVTGLFNVTLDVAQGTIAQGEARGGLADTTYKVKCTVSTNKGQTLEGYGYVRVVS